MKETPNIIYILVDQLRACSLPNYGFRDVPMPNFEKLGMKSITFDQAISTYPLCTPCRAMMFTGRNPQTTGLFVNFTSLRHDEIGMGDVFKNAGYETGYVGKWHLHRGAFPSKEQCWIPEGRSRLGFDYWRAYNCHTEYFNGNVNTNDWRTESWEGYETEGLLKYFKEFIDSSIAKETPFLCVLSPHQPHHTLGKHAPDYYYNRLPENLALPENVDPSIAKDILKDYRDYLAMILALDDMLGSIMEYMKEKKLWDNTILVVTSDHGTQMGAHINVPTDGTAAWAKRRPYEESIHVPLFIHLPDNQESGTRNDKLFAPIDILPTLCGLSGVTVPRTVEGRDLSSAVRGKECIEEQEALYLMNFSNYDYSPDWIPVPGNEWRGVRTKEYTYIKWRDGNEEFYDLKKDMYQMHNCVKDEEYQSVIEKIKKYYDDFQKRYNDEIHPCTFYRDWIDSERRIIRNAYGELSDPESIPDWSMLRR